jgi:signal recognition particle GTPase
MADASPTHLLANTHHAQYGKVGAKGTTTIKDFPDNAKAKAFIVKQVDAKEKKGYAFALEHTHAHNIFWLGSGVGDTSTVIQHHMQRSLFSVILFLFLNA